MTQAKPTTLVRPLHHAPLRVALALALASPLGACAADGPDDDSAAAAAPADEVAAFEAALGGQPDPIRVQAILTANTDGSEAAWVTPAEIQASVAEASRILAPANILLTFDPDSDVVRMNSDLLNHDCVVASGTNLDNHDPGTEPPSDCDIGAVERDRVAATYPGKLVVYFASGDRLRWDDATGRWIVAPRTFYWSNGTNQFVAMGSGNPGGQTLAHEMEHYLHLPHTFGSTPTTLADARRIIREYIEGHHLPKGRGLDVFEGDQISDTPPDPGPGLFVAAGLDPCNASQGTLNLNVPFSDGSSFTYSISPDRENIMNYWDKICRGGAPHVSNGQVATVRDALENQNRKPLIDPKVLYSAVWEPGDRGQTRAIGWSLGDFATRFNNELANGRHAVHVQAYDIGGGQIRFDGVWELGGNRGQTRALGWAFNDFATRNQNELAAGRHVVLMQAYDLGGGQMRWNGVWEAGSTNQTWALGWAPNDFAARFNQETAAGRHAVHVQAYLTSAGICYDGIFEPGSTGQTRALGWALGDFATRFNQEIAAGKHLVHMQAYDPGGGQIRWDGVWENGSRGTTRALGWAFNDFVARNQAEIAAGKHLVHMQAYDIGWGQVRYDGVWENGSTGQERLLSDSITPFATRFNAETGKAFHMVLMQAHTGR